MLDDLLNADEFVESRIAPSAWSSEAPVDISVPKECLYLLLDENAVRIGIIAD